MRKEQEMVTETVVHSNVIGGTNCIVDLIADLQAILERIPQEFRSSAVIEIEAYDYEGSIATYERPITEAEIAERAAGIEAQRQRAAMAAENGQTEKWLRNIRLWFGCSRDEALEFLRTDQDANRFHPDTVRTGNHGHA